MCKIEDNLASIEILYEISDLLKVDIKDLIISNKEINSNERK